MSLTTQIWNNAVSLYEKYKFEKKILSRESISQELNVSESEARGLLYSLKNLDIMTNKEIKLSDIKKPNILIIDIETAPIMAWVWGAWKQNIQPSHIISDWFMLTWSAKWLFEPEIFSGKITPEEVKVQDDSRIVEEVWQFLDAADVIIAHNGKKFDDKKMKTRFLLHGLNPPMPYQIIDTLEVAKKQFSFTHNRLDYINKLLGVGRKLDTNFQLWVDCIAGKQEALDNMEIYNKEDVGILEETYVKFRPYIKSHPNLGLFVDADSAICPTCGTTDLEWGGTYTTTVNKYSAFRCKGCGSIGRSRVTELTKEQKRNVMSPIAR